MNKEEVFIAALKAGMFKKLSFVRNSLAKPTGPNDWVNIEDGKFLVTLPDRVYAVEGDVTKSLFDLRESIVLPNGCLRIVKTDIKTTYGRAIVNYVLLEHGLDGFIDYINDEVSMSKLRNDVISPRILSGELPITAYKKVINASTFLRSLADIVVVAATKKMVFAPEGLPKFKKKTRDEYAKKHGKEWTKDKKLVLEYEKVLEDYYNDYLKDDPTYGITLDKKMFKSIKSRQIALGILDSIDPDADNAAIMTSLYDGLPFDDPEALSTVFNNIIYGSHSRGTLTQIGGVISKILTRATHNYKIDKEDCGVSYGVTVDVTEHMIGRYMVNGTLITPDNIDSMIGKRVEMRSLVYCKEKGEHYCKICAGKTLGSAENNILLISLSIGGSLLKFFLSKFHRVDRNLIKISKDLLF